MKDKINTKRSEHKKKLKEVRISRLEKQLKSNILKRKKVSKKNKKISGICEKFLFPFRFFNRLLGGPKERHGLRRHRRDFFRARLRRGGRR